MEHVILENGGISHDFSTLGSLFLQFDNDIIDFPLSFQYWIADDA